MPKNQYDLYWSILDSPSKAIRSYDVFLLVSVICAICILTTLKYKKSNGNGEKTILISILSFVLLFSTAMFTYAFFFDNDSEFKATERLLNSDKANVVEGEIENFKRFHPARGKGMVTEETFDVDTVHFSYSDEVLGRFNRFTKTNNKVFEDGLEVRITYRKGDNQIFKVEIMK